MSLTDGLSNCLSSPLLAKSAIMLQFSTARSKHVFGDASSHDARTQQKAAHRARRRNGCTRLAPEPVVEGEMPAEVFMHSFLASRKSPVDSALPGSLLPAMAVCHGDGRPGGGCVGVCCVLLDWVKGASGN